MRRRNFLTKALALVAALPFVPVSFEISRDTTTPIVEGCQCPHCSPDLWLPAAQPRPPHPDSARTQMIDNWIVSLDHTLTKLETLWSALKDARVAAPGNVDIAALLDLQNDAHTAIVALDADFENEQFDNLLTALTGRSAVACLFEQLIKHGQIDSAKLEHELNSFTSITPAEADRLRALLSAQGGAS